MRSTCFIKYFEVWSSYFSSWNWWNRSPSLFKPPFHNYCTFPYIHYFDKGLNINNMYLYSGGYILSVTMNVLFVCNVLIPNIYIFVSSLAEWLEWLLFNANSAIFQLCHVENKLTINEMMMGPLFVLDQPAEMDFHSASSLKQQSAGRHVAPLGHIILIPSQPVFLLNAACVAEKQQIPAILSLAWPNRASNPRSTALVASTLIITPPMRSA
jgi:hypothetical protein